MLEPIHEYYNRYDEEGRLSPKHGQVGILDDDALYQALSHARLPDS